MRKSVWARVSAKQPCLVCKKTDWCTFSEGVSCCMRVQSDKPMKNGGWLHRQGTERSYIAPMPVQPKPDTVNCLPIWQLWRERTSMDQVKGFASSLGVSPIALSQLGTVWAQDHQAWAFPMRNGFGAIVGIRLRDLSGRKWAVKGSRQGLFMPEVCCPTLYVCEGPTDTAAALTMGLYAIGRPSCLGCEDYVNQVIERKKVKEVVIVSDNDDPGIRGAEALQSKLKVPSCIFLPPCKDLRQFLEYGGHADLMESTVRSLIWKQPTLRQDVRQSAFVRYGQQPVAHAYI